jgi:hypothetical protein
MAVLGGRPDITTDIPISAVFIALYLTCAITNIAAIFIPNKKAGHKFLISIAFTGFCMARVLTNALRIAWATELDNVSLVIAAMIFTNLGVIALYVINLIFAQRILRAQRPKLGWNPILRVTFKALYASIAVCVVLLLTFTVLSFYTLDQSLLLAARDIQLAVSTYLLVICVLPYVMLAAAFFTPATSEVEEFGHGSMRVKVMKLLALTTLMVLEQGYKVGTAWVLTPHSRNDPPWYDGKAYFYALGFMLEIIYLIIVLVGRADRRFHVPNGSSQRKTYVVEPSKELESSHSDTEGDGRV